MVSTKPKIFLLWLYSLLNGGLLVGVKAAELTFAADYSPELHFSSVCVNYISLTKVSIRE